MFQHQIDQTKYRFVFAIQGQFFEEKLIQGYMILYFLFLTWSPKASNIEVF